jgi:crotonobetainyl-CoA:carnitine CoA-transferase CaiB-like acyl-CoA transferase
MTDGILSTSSSPKTGAAEVSGSSAVAGAPDPACRSVESADCPGDEVGPAAFDTGAPDPACRSVESADCPGDEVGPAGFQAGVSKPMALAGLRVLDCATLFAGPLAATMLGDFGADIIKVEHPRGDPARTHGPSKEGVGLWWKMLSRNKRCLSLYLGSPAGREVFLKLVATADVVIENFRPGTFEKWGLGPDVLFALNPRLVMARVTGFGQFGPSSHRPGFGTLAEAMSGFAAITGEPDGPPTLPPFGLADGISALSLSSAIMIALYARDATPPSDGESPHGAAKRRGQIIDLAIIEPILTLLGAQPTIYDQLGTVQERSGNRSANNAPRNTYQCLDGKWVAISTSTTSIAERVLRMVGHPEVIEEPWFGSGAERAKRADLLDGYVAAWIAERNQPEVLAEFDAAEAAVAPIYDVRDIFADPQFAALDTITTVADPELGQVRMQNVLYRMSETPGSIRWAGRPVGADNDEILRALGIDLAEQSSLVEQGVVGS